MTDKELMQMALDALEWCYDVNEWPANGDSAQDKAIDALRTRLAQPEQEPVAWGVPNTRPTEKAMFMMLLHSLDGCQYPEQLVPLYTTPPQREWQGLTDEDVWELVQKTPDFSETVAAIEAKLKEKNT